MWKGSSCIPRRYRNRVEFKGQYYVFPFVVPPVDIETEWNLKVRILTIPFSRLLVDIETEWNLKDGCKEYLP